MKGDYWSCKYDFPRVSPNSQKIANFEGILAIRSIEFLNSESVWLQKIFRRPRKRLYGVDSNMKYNPDLDLRYSIR